MALRHNSHSLKEIFNEEEKWFLAYRIAHRRGDYSDHRGHRNSELAQVPYGSERVLGCWFCAYFEHRSDHLPELLPSDGTTCAGGANIIDNVLGSGTKSGYTFASVGKTGTPTTQYDTNASPLTLNVTGVRYFYSNETGVIRGNTGGAASATSQALQSP